MKLLVRNGQTVPFRYVNKGNLATIGRYKAVADFGSFRLTGWVAWWFWLFVHILYLVGFRNRISVLVQWAYAYFTYQRGVRLITHEDQNREDRIMAANSTHSDARELAGLTKQ